MIVDDPKVKFKAKRVKPNWIDVAIMLMVLLIFALTILYGNLVRGVMTSEQVVGTPYLNAALAKAQGEFLPIKKTKTDYADLQDVISATVPALSKNGLSITMPIYIDEKLGCTLKVILRHSSGQVIESSFPLGLQHSNPQDLGTLISYYRLYLLTALLNIASEERLESQ